MGYGEELEHYSSMGFSNSDAAMYADSGIRPRFDQEGENEEEQRDRDCPTTAEYDADPGKYIWIRPFGNQFRVYTYDTEAKNGYEIATICDKPTMAEAQQARLDRIAEIASYQPIGIAAVIDDIMRRFK